MIISETVVSHCKYESNENAKHGFIPPTAGKEEYRRAQELSRIGLDSSTITHVVLFYSKKEG